MPRRVDGGEWSPEVVRRFWDWYSRQPGTQDDYFSKQVGRGIVRLLELSGGLRGDVLDFGCGPGFLLDHLTRVRGLSCRGCDSSAEAVAATEERLRGRPGWRGGTVVEGFETKLPDAGFDVVTCIETVEHLPDAGLDVLLAEIRRLLKPSGTALFTTPFEEDLAASQSYCPFCDREYHKMQHLRAFTADALRGRLEAAGYRVAWCGGIDFARFQPSRRPFAGGPKRVVRRASRAVRNAVAGLLDRVSPRPFPTNRAFLARATPGPHLVAVARIT